MPYHCRRLKFIWQGLKVVNGEYLAGGYYADIHTAMGLCKILDLCTHRHRYIEGQRSFDIRK